jgi:hypothetical protein
MSPPMPSPIPRSGEKRAQQNARILLVIQFPRNTATVTALDYRYFWAFNDSICEALFSVFGG